MKAMYEKCSAEDYPDAIYDDGGAYMTVEKNYVQFNCHSTPKEWDDFFASLNLPDEVINENQTRFCFQ
jgi:hypothetical protein